MECRFFCFLTIIDTVDVSLPCAVVPTLFWTFICHIMILLEHSKLFGRPICEFNDVIPRFVEGDLCLKLLLYGPAFVIYALVVMVYTDLLDPGILACCFMSQ